MVKTSFKKWSEVEIAALRKAYASDSPGLDNLAKRLGRLKSNICRKAREVGLGTSTHRGKSAQAKERMRISRGGFSNKEQAWFISNFQKFTNRELAAKLGRTDRFISKQVRRLGLKKMSYQERGWIWRSGHPHGFGGKLHSERSKKIMSTKSKQAWKNPGSKLNTDGHRQMLSDRAVKTQKGAAGLSRFSRCKSGARADLGGLFVRSGWEANYARYLKWMKGRGEIRDWSYESQTFDFPIKRGTRFYTPDFKVIENDGSVAFHEVKGWMTQKSRTALDRMGRYYPDVKIILITKPEYLSIRKSRALIPGWEA